MNKGRILAVDYGARRAGFALSSQDETMAFPYAILENGPKFLKEVVRIVRDERVHTLVVGESRTYAGEENPINSRARAFAETLEKECHVTVAFENETLSTQHARRAYERREKTRKQERREEVDASAAALILQSYLDKQRYGKNNNR